MVTEGNLYSSTVIGCGGELNQSGKGMEGCRGLSWRVTEGHGGWLWKVIAEGYKWWSQRVFVEGHRGLWRVVAKGHRGWSWRVTEVMEGNLYSSTVIGCGGELNQSGKGMKGHKGWLQRVVEGHRGSWRVAEGGCRGSQRVVEGVCGGLWRVAEGGHRGSQNFKCPSLQTLFTSGCP